MSVLGKLKSVLKRTVPGGAPKPWPKGGFDDLQGNGGPVRLRNDGRPIIINDLIRSHGYKSYLEIGIRDARTIKVVDCPVRHGVDPAHPCSHQMTSDKFFAELPDDFKYDLIFIDGLHLEAQVDKDIVNSLKHLSEGGTIVMHDCSPENEDRQRHYDDLSKIKGVWNGTVWRSYAKLRMERKDLSMFVIDMDHGIGVIRPGKQSLFKMPKGRKLDYSLLSDFRRELLNAFKPVWVCNMDEALRIVEAEEKFFLSDCHCQHGIGGDARVFEYPCITFKQGSPSAGDNEREVDKSEVKRMLGEAAKKGLVPIAFRDDRELAMPGGLCLCSDELRKYLLGSSPA